MKALAPTITIKLRLVSDSCEAERNRESIMVVYVALKESGLGDIGDLKLFPDVAPISSPCSRYTRRAAT